MHEKLAALCDAVDAALDAPDLTDRERAGLMRSAMVDLVRTPEAVPDAYKQPFDGGAVGWLLHDGPGGRYHVLSVVFPEGTSSGVHFHGCWGVIGYMHGGDEETRYASDDVPVEGESRELEELSRHVWSQGDVVYLLPPEDGWHRVRNPGPGTGVSIHVLCMRPSDHPHLFWDRDTRRVLAFPFHERAPGAWVAEVERS